MLRSRRGVLRLDVPRGVYPYPLHDPLALPRSPLVGPCACAAAAAEPSGAGASAQWGHERHTSLNSAYLALR